MDDENSETTIKSIKRIQEYPLIRDSFTKANEYYNWIKQKNTTLNSSLTYTEDSLKSVINKMEPIATSKLGAVDQFACNQLDNLEAKYPIIKESSESIVASTSQYYDTSVKPKVVEVKDNVAYLLTTPFRITSKAIEYLSSTTDTFVSRFLTSNSKCEDKEKKMQKTEYDALFGRALKEINTIRFYTRESIEGLTNLLTSIYNNSVSKNKELINKYYQEYNEELKSKNEQISLLHIANLLTNKLRMSIRAVSAVCYNHLSNDNKEKMNLVFKKTEILYSALITSTYNDIHEKLTVENVKWIGQNTVGLLDNVKDAILDKYNEDVGEAPQNINSVDFNYEEDSNSETSGQSSQDESINNKCE